jgi:4-amino-4-deoxy-L-arabinose transferase-like glycosyltransferase
MTTDAERPASGRPSGADRDPAVRPVDAPPSLRRRLVRFAALAAATATLLTNAYYLRGLEPRIPRTWAAAVLLAACSAALAWSEGPWTRARTDWRSAARAGAVPLLLGAILSVAFALRVWGITAGLPQSYIADEYDFVNAQLRMMKTGDLNPHAWYHPSLQPYLAMATYTVVFLLEAPSGRWSHVAQITEEDMLYWGRFVGVLAGTATVFVAFLIGRRVFGTRVALLAAALLAVFPGAVEHSQYNKPDPLLALMSAVSVLVTLVYLERGGRGIALASGIAIGLTASAKYNGILVVLPFLLAAAFRHGRRTLFAPDVYLGALGSVIGFALGCPFFLTQLNLFLDHLADGLYTYGFEGLPGAEGVDNWAGHAAYTSRFGAGYWATRAALAGLGLALYRIDTRLAVFLSFPVLYYAYYGSQRIAFRGNLIPVYTFLAILAAYAAVELLAWIARTAGARRRLVVPLAAVLLLALLLVPPLRTAIAFDRAVTRRDTGTIAHEWIDAHFPPGTHLALERFTPVLDGARYKITSDPKLINRSVQSYRDDGVQYLVVSSLAYDRFPAEHNQTRSYQKLFALCPLVAEFPGLPGQRPGPTIRILQVPAKGD